MIEVTGYRLVRIELRADQSIAVVIQHRGEYTALAMISASAYLAATAQVVIAVNTITAGNLPKDGFAQTIQWPPVPGIKVKKQWLF